MDVVKLEGLIKQAADTTFVEGSTFRFLYKNRLLICISDAKANRMRIITPVVKRVEVGEDELLNALVANFHSVLDVKYALSDEKNWSLFTHPLKEL